MLSVVIVGINQWEQYTHDLIYQIKHFEPDVEIIVVDNGSKEPYPEVDEAQILRIDHIVCYSDALNRGLNLTSGDWLMWMNNDITCHGKFAQHVMNQERNALYSRQIIEEAGHVWFGNWIGCMPYEIWNEVGQFDINFAVCGFEDCDYSMRCKDIGYDTKPIELPFIHHWGKTRWAIPGYEGTRARNINYFELKHGWRPGSNMAVTHD